jgi:hypothetical protein
MGLPRDFGSTMGRICVGQLQIEKRLQDFGQSPGTARVIGVIGQNTIGYFPPASPHESPARLA